MKLIRLVSTYQAKLWCKTA